MNSYTYDAASNRTSLTAPDGSISTYGFDTRNRLNALANSWVRSFGYSYDALSRRTQLTRPNGVNTNYSYDSQVTQGASTMESSSYDSVGNRLSIIRCAQLQLQCVERADLEFVGTLQL